MSCERWSAHDLVATLFIGLTLLWANSTPAQASESNPGLARQKLFMELRDSGARVGIDQRRGVARFVGAERHAPVQVAGVSPGAPASFNAMVIAEKYGDLFGVSNPREDLMVRREGRNATGGGKVRYQQRFKGVPVMGGELTVNMDRGGALLSINGKTGAVPANLAVTPLVDMAKAKAKAVAAVGKWYDMPASALDASLPELTVYDATLLGPASSAPVRLVWRLEVRPRKVAPIRELVLVDAKSGGIALHFNQVDTARNRLTYSANHSTTLPGTLKCAESDDGCTNGADKEADFAHLYAGVTYDYYMSRHGRDSYDNAGATLISSVNYYDGGPSNAYWDGFQVVYWPGFADADDVVAHELTHAFTEQTSNLFYYYQSGAINESLSDLWGEFVDQSDGYGNDLAAAKWLLGEDLAAPDATGAIRDMKNPPAYGHPDKMSSNLYDTSSADSGGVHTNSGINNKAVYLMTDGGTFNSRTVTGLGLAKVDAIYYEAQTNLLSSGSDYLDLYNDLNQACANLVGGAAGITSNDCAQVLAATTAVEMNKDPSTTYNPEAEVCPAGHPPINAFFDDFEGGLGNWTLTAGTGSQTWVRSSTSGAPNAASGKEALLGEDIDTVSDQQATITVDVPAGQPYLHFRHFFDFEQARSNYYYDGGVLEYSTNGSTWTNVFNSPSLYSAGKNYTGTIYQSSGNPLKGSKGFVGSTNGYVSTRLNLKSLAGQNNVKLRWRVGTDSGGGSYGWYLDDVRVYTCSNQPPTANAGAPQNVAKGAKVTLDGSSSSDSDGTIASYAWTQTAGIPVVTLANATTARPSFTAPAVATTLTFQLTVTDDMGATASATTTVATPANTAPVAEAGPAQNVNAGASVTLDGSGSSDSDGTIASYAWIQTGGTAVTLNNANSATATFTAPAGATILSFRLTVTDNEGATGADTTTVTVNVPAPPPAPAPAPAPAAGGGGGGGGGCSISKDGGSDPFLAVLLLGATVLLRRRRKIRA